MARHLTWDDIQVEQRFSFEKFVTSEDVERFALLTGDYNPLHVDPTFGAKTKFGKNIVHGMLLASFFSTLVGMHCPGERSLYLSQTLNFRKPVTYGERVTIRGIILQKIESVHVIVMKTEVVRGDGQVAVDGEAHIKMREVS